MERIWKQEGLKIPAKQPKRKRLWFNDASCIRLRPTWENHVWAYDFVQARTHNGKAFRILVVIDEYSRKCLALVARAVTAEHVMHVLADLFLEHGVPDNIRSDNGPEFIAKKLRRWLSNLHVQTQYIEPGSPCENGYCESFNGKLGDELLNGEIFMSMKEAEVVIAQWRMHYNIRRPHSSLGGLPPAPATYFPCPSALASGIVAMHSASVKAAPFGLAAPGLDGRALCIAHDACGRGAGMTPSRASHRDA